jgi:hypothetical protein
MCYKSLNSRTCSLLEKYINSDNIYVPNTPLTDRLNMGHEKKERLFMPAIAGQYLNQHTVFWLYIL